MAWVAVDKYGNESVYSVRPARNIERGYFVLAKVKVYKGENNTVYETVGECVDLPKGTIRKILGYELTWDNDPVQIR